ncbi:ubiquitin-conjugating enzyme E2 U isoform X1 [Sarcophilus harrisii]|uniref:Ubiquitin conjugating enzyme E2 U n=1 Tax=Sarcophilus harrisii TaxID=9305 RepID=A0A7N4UXD6_SARHA|nr:ubiquitin-conjugating enzyme E2 U isoform X1 [Sarcophilus harrisii]
MHCRSYYLLEKEFMELQEQELFGITVTPLTDDLLKWIAEIEGLKDTDWEGFTFPLILQFSVKYNIVPPVVTFSCIPFHPNVDPVSGRPCIDFLDNPDLWDKNYTLSSILLSIQVMLSNPTVNNAVNSEAAKMMMESNKLFREIALKSIYESYNLDEETEEEEETSVSIELVEGTISPLCEKTVKGVSFDEYYRTWSGIATSQTANCFKIPVSHDITGSYQKWKKSHIKPDWDAKFHSVMARIARENRLPSKLDRSFIQSIKNAQYNASETNMNLMDLESKGEDDAESWNSKEKKNKSSKESDDMDEAWENEVENLVAWTNKLNATTLED